MQITRDGPEFATATVRIAGNEIGHELIIAADDELGRVWCWQVDAVGARMKTIEIKTGPVTIELPAASEDNP